MNLLVIGGTGMVGSQTVANLIKRGIEVRVMTHSKDKARHLPVGATAVTGDLAQPATLRAAFSGVDRAFLITPLDPHETEKGIAAVETAREAGVRRIVYMAVPMPPGSLRIPHFRSKVPIIDAIKASGIEYTILAPNNFFQNDLFFADRIMQHGTYPQPFGSVGLNRVDVRDIAEAALNALTESGHAGKTYPLVGPEAMTGYGTAEIWSHYVGRRIGYAGDDLDSWEQYARQMLPGWLVDDFRVMYEYFQENGLLASDADFEQQSRILHHSPRRFEDFAAEVAQSWQIEAVEV